MGTRNLICVYLDGEYKVAQYGQWDGYPEGQGIACLEFLRDKVNWLLFAERLRRLSWIDDRKLKLIRKPYQHPSGGMTMEMSDLFEQTYPEFSRNTAAEILELIQDDKLMMNKLVDNLDFAAEDDCEWCYVIDIDKGSFEVYEGWNKEQLTPDERFYELDRELNNGSKKRPWHAAKLRAMFDLNNLPDNETFLREFSGGEEE